MSDSDKEIDEILADHRAETWSTGWNNDATEKAKQRLNALIERKVRVDESTSDGFHTFKELYRYRLLYNAALFNEWGRHKTVPVVKSKRHADGELCFGGGWFIVVAELPQGQISNHYELKDWNLFDISEHAKVPWEFDGHTPQDVEKRLTEFLFQLQDNQTKGDPDEKV